MLTELLSTAAVWDAPGRDPRGRYVTVAYAAVAYAAVAYAAVVRPDIPAVAGDDARTVC